MANTDIGIITGILGFMFLLAFCMPYIQDALGEDQTIFSYNSVEDNINGEVSDPVNTGEISSVNAWNVVGSLVTMFFWSYTFLPAWLQIFFLIIRIVLLLLLIKYIPFVGSGS